MEGKAWTLMFLEVSDARIPFRLLMILRAGLQVFPPSADRQKPMAVSSEGQVL
jgi:hypothetical protein